MELPDKSSGSPQPRKKIDAVVDGVVPVKRPASKRFKDFLMAESPKVLFGRIAQQVLIPRAKAGLEEAANSFISGMFWGDGSNRPPSQVLKGTVLRPNGMNYSGISQGMNPMAMAMHANQQRSAGNYQDLICPNQQVAETLLANMYELLNSYNRVAVADLYELAGITPQPSDNMYGWSDLTGARIMKDRSGFLLELPRPSLL